MSFRTRAGGSLDFAPSLDCNVMRGTFFSFFAYSNAKLRAQRARKGAKRICGERRGT
jgi:hypothetical protein